ncbi:hypothetical protein ABFS83_09G093700 [Erythranthe nasuta]
MGDLFLNLTPTSYFLVRLFFFLLLGHVLVHAQDDVCANVDCVKGKCVQSSGSIFGYDCECFFGWKKVELGPLIIPACVLPNCTLDLECEGGAPPPPLPPSFDVSNPCNFVWCGDGSCVVNGTGHYCQCNQGSSNLLSNTSLVCLKQCSFGADCSALGFCPPVITEPPNGMLAPPPPSLTPPPPPLPPTKGSGESSNGRRNRGDVNMALLTATILVLAL